jgi:serine/threonine-protein kinase
VKLLDFGIAKLAAPDGAMGGGAYDPTFTQPQLLTPAYASPEQLRGDRASTASDVYALGVLLFRMLTGRTPARRAADVVRGAKPASYESPPTLGPDLPASLNEITTRALQPDMARRYQTGGELAAAVRAYLSGAPGHGRSLGERVSAILASMRRLLGVSKRGQTH